MENKEIIFLTPGQTTFDKLFMWLRNTVVRILNKQWIVVLPQNWLGSATFKDSQNQVILDLSLVTSTGPNGGPQPIVVSGDTTIVVTPTTDPLTGQVTYTITFGGGTTTIGTCSGPASVLTPP